MAQNLKQFTLKNLLVSASYYGVSVALAKASSVILLPVFWHVLSAEDFGVIGIVQLLQAFLVPILSLGLFDGVLRFYFEWSEEDRRGKIGALCTLIIFWSTLFCFMALAAQPLFERIFTTVPAYPYLWIALATALTSCLNQFPLTILRIRGEARRFSLIVSLTFVTQSFLSVVFVFGLEKGLIGYLSAAFVSQVIWAVYLLCVIRSDISLNFNWRSIEDLLSYSVPMMPATILDSTNGLFDRYFLDKFVPLGSIGIYNVAQQFASIVSLANQSLKSAWFPFVYRLVQTSENAPSELSRFSRYYMGVMAFPSLGVAIFGGDLIHVFGAPKFEDAATVIPLMVLAAYLQVVIAALGRGLDLAKKNALWIVISGAHCIASIAALTFFVPRWGLMGAAIGVVVALTVRAFLQCTLAYMAYPRPIAGLRIMGIFVVSALAVGLCAVIPESSLYFQLFWKAMIFLGAVIVLIPVLLSPADWRSILTNLRNHTRNRKHEGTR